MIRALAEGQTSKAGSKSVPFFDRSVALVVILTRAGLGLDPEALRKLSFVVLRLAMMPCLVEATVVAVVSNLLLGFPWKWGFMLG